MDGGGDCLVASLGTSGAAFFRIRQMWLPNVLAAMRPASAVSAPPPAAPVPGARAVAPPLGLNTVDREGQLRIGLVGSRTSSTSCAARRQTPCWGSTRAGRNRRPSSSTPHTCKPAPSRIARTAEKVDVKTDRSSRRRGRISARSPASLGKLPGRKPAEKIRRPKSSARKWPQAARS